MPLGRSTVPSYPAMGALQQRQPGGFTGGGFGGRPPLTRQNAPAAPAPPTTNAPMVRSPGLPPVGGLPPRGGEMRPPAGPPGMPPMGPPSAMGPMMSNYGEGMQNAGAMANLGFSLPQGSEQFFGADLNSFNQRYQRRPLGSR